MGYHWETNNFDTNKSIILFYLNLDPNKLDDLFDLLLLLSNIDFHIFAYRRPGLVGGEKNKPKQTDEMKIIIYKWLD